MTKISSKEEDLVELKVKGYNIEHNAGELVGINLECFTLDEVGSIDWDNLEVWIKKKEVMDTRSFGVNSASGVNNCDNVVNEYTSYHSVEEEECLENLRKLQEDKYMKGEVNSWTFQSPSPDYIDYEEISKDLSYASPIILIRSGSLVSVLVYYKLVEKSGEDYDWDLVGNNFYMSHCVNEKEFSSWVEWAKEVKERPWSNAGKTTVTVSIPKI